MTIKYILKDFSKFYRNTFQYCFKNIFLVKNFKENLIKFIHYYNDFVKFKQNQCNLNLNINKIYINDFYLKFLIKTSSIKDNYLLKILNVKYKELKFLIMLKKCKSL
jgi:hypothetical protein